MTNQNTKLIGITGGIATGKSTVSEILRQLGYPVICADKIVHEFYAKDHPVFSKIVTLVGHDYLNSDGSLDRTKIGEVLFANPHLKQSLENLIHPLVRKELQKKIEVAKKNSPFVFVDIPLLFESNLEDYFDKVVCVTATQKVQIERLKKHRNLPQKQALIRLHSQMPMREKIKMSDFVIYNNRSRSELSKKIKEVLGKLTNKLKKESL